jgi:hypothetical protein
MSLDCDYEDIESQREEESESERIFREKCEAAGFDHKASLREVIFSIMLRLKALEKGAIPSPST